MDDDLLTEHTVIPYILGRTVLTSASSARALSGGVSNVVLEVSGEPYRVVVKQSLERLRVADEWLAPRRRILSEARALELLGSITPDAVPRVLDIDPDRMTVIMSHAGDGWRDWKSVLMRGEVDTTVASRLGSLLGQWHSATTGADLPSELTDPEAFEVLRLRPYHETVAERVPDVADAVNRVAHRMRQSRVCLVHGDFSPKNILVSDGGGLWVIDAEVAHLGDPHFDVAFLLAHLSMKAVHLSEVAPRFDSAAGHFFASYEASRPASIDQAYLAAQVGALLMARVVGKSPAEYLNPSEKASVAVMARALLDGTVTSVAEIPALRMRSSA